MGVKARLNLAKVNALMASQGLRQRDLHRMTGLSRGHISQLLSGKRPRASWATIYRLARVLGVDVEELVGEEDGTSSPSL